MEQKEQVDIDPRLVAVVERMMDRWAVLVDSTHDLNRQWMQQRTARVTDIIHKLWGWSILYPASNGIQREDK